MLTVVRRSQVQGLMTMDSSTLSHLGEVQEVWLDETGKVAYLSGSAGYLPLEQVARISHQALSTYGRLLVATPDRLRRLDQLAVHSALGEPLGWVEDFLFDWHTGEIAAYILAGQIAEPLGEYAVLYPEDVKEITVDYLVIASGAEKRLKPASEGLRGFFSEQSHQVQHLIQLIADRVHHLVAPHDQPEVVRVKVKEASDELAASGQHDHHALAEATSYLQEQWQALHQSISRSGERAKAALHSAWKRLTGSP
ncbi:MAG: photosystem reaction center subunit H [Synechococcales cyanobacterium M58_A2018_015]|nr:photosystem reaction center subunit H [Synechococcales cyanobacterium M58_A2018_015]